MNHIDLRYSGILSTRLERYVVKNQSPYRANVRCPICGDSDKSITKARGWILERKNSAWYYCHNCGASMGLGNLIKFVSPALHDEYIADSYLEKRSTKRLAPKPVKALDTLMKRPAPFKKSPLSKLKKISQLDESHPAKQYVLSRKIPSSKHYVLYYAPKFKEWVHSILPDKLGNSLEEDRLVIPFIDVDGNLMGFAGRSLSAHSTLRYITIMLDDVPKIFGMNDVDFYKPYFIVEGQLDCLFLSNAVAMAGSDGNTNGLFEPQNGTFVFDNEPRNVEIVHKMEKVINRGGSIVVWPYKVVDNDINNMILSGHTSQDIERIMRDCTFSGPEAMLELSMWRKC